MQEIKINTAKNFAKKKHFHFFEQSDKNGIKWTGFAGFFQIIELP